MSLVGTAMRRGPESTVAVLLQHLREGLRLDLRRYGELRALLEGQFGAALAHDPVRMGELSAAILALSDEFEVTRLRRHELLVALLGRGTPTHLRALVERLPDAAAEPLLTLWRQLETALSECKALNLRNCELISEQQALMQQLLGREEHVYAQP
ncbi:flagellar protein FlgN [Roseateles amylovorans]|uniref:Flagellar protein FlgN n=1 Tax=Roseateles amylovorans TaxID=2978473 RepID=A0ABY6AUJ2_9BURK|nr:flagellar protein FlgN [Roseateles amylovorans]UXH76889.1 flagellar protein FlgN [Roseateles amylovorans]